MYLMYIVAALPINNKIGASINTFISSFNDLHDYLKTLKNNYQHTISNFGLAVVSFSLAGTSRLYIHIIGF